MTIVKQNYTSYIMKPVCIINKYNSKTLSTVAKKSYNIMLLNAKSDIDKGLERFSITIQELQKMLGIKQTNYTYFRKIIESVMQTLVRFDILEEDKKSEEMKMSYSMSTTLLSGCKWREKENVIHYEFSKYLLEVLKDPSAYAKLDVMVQERIKGKHSLSIWEHCKFYLNYHGGSYTKSKEITVKQFRDILGVHSKAYDNFKHFNQQILTPAIKEINEKSDITIQPVFKRTNRKTSHIHFIVMEKSGEDLKKYHAETKKDSGELKKYNTNKEKTKQQVKKANTENPLSTQELQEIQHKNEIPQENTEELKKYNTQYIDYFNKLTKKYNINNTSAENLLKEYSFEQIEYALQKVVLSMEQKIHIINLPAYVTNAIQKGFKLSKVDMKIQQSLKNASGKT